MRARRFRAATTRVFQASIVVCFSLPAYAQVQAQDHPEQAAAATPAQDAAPSRPAADPTPDWIATLSSGVLARDGDAARPFVVAGLSRRIGRGYVRVSATGFRSVVRQVDAALPSSFVLASVGGGGTFGQWFVDGYASAGRQRYGGVTTPLGTRPAQVGKGSGVYGAALSGGRFVALTRRLYLTPSAAVQYTTNRTLRSALGPMGPRDYETRERAWTGSVTVRVDRFFGRSNQHVLGLSISHAQTSNGVIALTSGSGPGGAALTAVSVADSWFVPGMSASLRIRKRVWLDGSASRTLGAQSGNFDVMSLGLRLGF